MKDNNIKPLKLPPNPKPTILFGEEDARLPKQIFNYLKNRDNLVEIVVFQNTHTNRKNQNRITLKQRDDFWYLCLLRIECVKFSIKIFQPERIKTRNGRASS